jgi:hypothetical protein
VSQSIDLREYEPHPVRAFQAVLQLSKDAIVDPALRADETVEFIGVITINGLAPFCHTVLLLSLAALKKIPGKYIVKEYYVQIAFSDKSVIK